MTREEYFKRRIREICPDLRISSIEFNSEGRMNDVVLVNDELVCRFAKDEFAASCLKKEIRVLNMLS